MSPLYNEDIRLFFHKLRLFGNKDLCQYKQQYLLLNAYHNRIQNDKTHLIKGFDS